jgi:hypothetical protein
MRHQTRSIEAGKAAVAVFDLRQRRLSNGPQVTRALLAREQQLEPGAHRLQRQGQRGQSDFTFCFRQS